MLYTLRGDYEAAERVAGEAIRLQDQAMSGTTGLIIVGAHSRLGYVLYRQGRYDEAIREYRRELELLSVGDHLLRERTSIELQQKLGAAYRRKGDVRTAETHETRGDRALRRASVDRRRRTVHALLHGGAATRCAATPKPRASISSCRSASCRVHALAPAARSGLRSGARTSPRCSRT